MPRATGNKQYLSFKGGKNTETNPIAESEAIFRIMDNVDIALNETVSRRLALDFEKDFALSASTYTQAEIKESLASIHPWLVVDEDGGLNFFIVRIADDLYIHDMSTESPSANLLGTISMAGNAVDAQLSHRTPIQISFGKGIAIVVGEFYNPFFIEFDQVAKTFATTNIDIMIRDFEGVDDGLDIDERPTTLSVEHQYNLQNQGWRADRYNAVAFPSNADIEHFGVKTDPSSGDLLFSVNELTQQSFGNTPAPKGHYIIDVFNEDRLGASGIFGLPPAGTNRRPRATAFFAGRVWYGGVRSNIYFSQILEDISFIDKCYQEQDPTAEDLNELLATDGGVVTIPEAGEIIAIQALDLGVLILGTNGVWYISGGTGNFSADSFISEKVTDAGVISPRSVVRVDNAVLFWSTGGIYACTLDTESGKVVANNLTENTIQTDYLTIPALAKTLASATYDRVARKVIWTYHLNADTNLDSYTSRYTNAIVLNTTFGSFNDYSFADISPFDNTPFVAGIEESGGTNEGISLDLVTTIAGETVTTIAGESLITEREATGSTQIASKVLTLVPDGSSPPVYKYTFSEFCSNTFKDWFTHDGVGANYASTLETAPYTLGDVTRKKQATYVEVYFNESRGGYGSLAGTGRPDPSFGFQISQVPVEVLRKGNPSHQVNQISLDVLVQV